MPFPFYNTAPPTPTTKNTINQIAVTYGIRDFLLNKNLLPQYPQLSTSINGGPRIGEPVLDTSINGDANVIPIGLPLEVVGLTRYNDAIAPNRFKNNDGIAPTLIDIVDVQQTQGIFGNIEYPQGTDSYPTSATQTVADYGLKGKTEYANFRKNATLFNLYVDTSQQIDMGDFISLQPLGINQQLPNYLDVYGGLNAGEQALNVIGSLLNGQGVGIGTGGLVPNFDIRASLAGRVLGVTGLLEDTKLGIIGAQQLALALANNAAFNLQENILDSLNIEENLLSLVKNGKFSDNRPNYTITVAGSGFLGNLVNYSSSILGFTTPRSFLSDSASIFSSENLSTNIDRANAMLDNTGKGQIVALLANANANLIGSGSFDNPEQSPFRSGYAPAYQNGKGEKAINPNLYAFYTSDGEKIINVFGSRDSTGIIDVIPEISYNRTKMIKEYGFKAPEDTFSGPKGNNGYNNRLVSNIGFTWAGKDGTVNSFPTDGDPSRIVNVNPSFLPLDNKKSLLTKTQKLFNSRGMKNIVSVKGDMNKTSTQIQTANGYGFSKGSAVLKGNRYINGNFDGQALSAEETYCRSWTTLDRYDTVNKMIRHSGLTYNYPYRFHIENSSLDDNGFPKIAPYITDRYFSLTDDSIAADPKRYMLSIENLAWCDNVCDLPPVEIGMGDLTTGKKGRIMWFPPYDISINESSSASFEKTDFIGRGESVYTYNNTERSGNLSFSIIVDHSSYTNAFRGTNGPDDNYVASFFAGCLDPEGFFYDRLTVSERSIIETSQTNPQPQLTQAESEVPPPLKFNVYFPNDVPDINKVLDYGYENGCQNTPNPNQVPIDPTLVKGLTPIDYTSNPTGINKGIGWLQGEVTPKKRIKDINNINYCSSRIEGKYSYWQDLTNYGYNAINQPIKIGDDTLNGIFDNGLTQSLINYLNNTCKYCKIIVRGYASPHGCLDTNEILAKTRADSILGYLKDKLKTIENYNKRFGSWITETKQIDQSNTDCQRSDDTNPERSTTDCKKDRRAEVEIVFDANQLPQQDVTPAAVPQTQPRTIPTKIRNRLYDESRYFEKLQQTDKFAFDKFKERIRYFHPAFHSMTPEGLNSRLTFLHQCTRQGPTLENVDTVNLAFGRAPICILRVGDFYHTKIVIDTLSIDYEPMVWDLNPEGIGIQPMIAKVSLSFKFIGGSSLLGPINKLQNALSFNYYANTHVYDPRADYLAKVNGDQNELNLQVGDTFKIMNDSDNGNVNIPIFTSEIINANNGEAPVITQNQNNIANKNNQIKSSPQPNWFDLLYSLKIIPVSEAKDEINTVNKVIVEIGLNEIPGLSTESEKESFFNDGLIISLSKFELGDIFNFDEIITYANNNTNLDPNKTITALFNTSYIFTINKKIKYGDYMLSLKNNGNTLIRINVTINQEEFNY